MALARSFTGGVVMSCISTLLDDITFSHRLIPVYRVAQKKPHTILLSVTLVSISLLNIDRFS